MKVHDVFQPGLIRGSEKMPFDPTKAYFYVEHPTEGWRVYLRACCFIHEKPVGDECIDPLKFIVVKRAGKSGAGREWEPPKGQMEGKDGLKYPKDSLINIMKRNIQREIFEESRITKVVGLRYTNLVLEGVEQDYKPNTFFQYHIFHAMVTPNVWKNAAMELDWYREHPAAFARLSRDKREKDELAWYSPSDTKLMGRWSPKIVAIYLSSLKSLLPA